MSSSSVKPLNVQLPAITLILFALCVGIFCYLAQWMSYEEVDQSALIHLGANVASLTLSDESWRLLSSVFLHSSFSHLLMNMFALLAVGTVAERILGKWRLLIIWLFSGIFGGLISACYALRESEQIVISVGASGAIMGIAGAAIATQLASGAGTHHKNQRRVFPLLGMVALTLLYGTRQTGIDNACHIGGLEAMKWVVVVALLLVAIVGNYLYRDIMLPLRALAVVILIAAAGGVADPDTDDVRADAQPGVAA